MYVAVLLGAASVCVYLLLRRRSSSSSSRDPPSPGWVPVLGSWPFFKEPIELHLSSSRFANQPLVVMYYGMRRIYYINTHSALREALVANGDNFLQRPQSLSLQDLTGEVGGVAMMNGSRWQQYRRFTLRTLRDFGFGRQAAEESIQTEARILCERIEAAAGQPLDTNEILSAAVSNVICQLVFGSRLAAEDQRFRRIADIFNEMTQQDSINSKPTIMLLLHAELLKLLPGVSAVLQRLMRKRITRMQEVIDFCREQVQRHRAELQPGAEPRDYIDAHLQHQETNSEFNDMRLILTIFELFIAGTDTTSHTLRWAILFLMENPHVAERVFQEISSQVGQRQVCTKDRVQLHYTQAVLEEVHRCASLLPLGLFHVAAEDTRVCGYTIPKGSTVMYNVFNIHHSEQQFPQPQQFRPERFLDNEGKFAASEHVVPFGLGKRSCLGESLARAELLIFFASLVQRFTFSLEPGDRRSFQEIKENRGRTGGSIRAPGPFKVAFARR